MSINRKQANCSKYNVSISFLFLYLASAKITVNTLKRMQKYKFYFEMEGRNGEKMIFKKKKMVLLIGNRGQAKRKQGTSETRTAD